MRRHKDVRYCFASSDMKIKFTQPRILIRSHVYINKIFSRDLEKRIFWEVNNSLVDKSRDICESVKAII